MNKQIPAILIFLLASIRSISQTGTQEFELTIPEQKAENGIYNKIDFLDSRIDTSNNGFVLVGGNNKKARIVNKTPLAQQLQGVITALSMPSAKDGELLFQLRRFYFSEGGGKGYCSIRASLYAKKLDKYQKLGLLDTLITVRGLDATGGVLKKGSRVITDFIASKITVAPADSSYYSHLDVQNIDEIEKRKMYLYMFNRLQDGLYFNYQSFMQQSPDRKVLVEMEDDKVASAKYENENGKWTKVNRKEVYAIVHNSIPFIVTSYGYFPVEKINNDYYFTLTAKVGPSASEAAAAGILFGLLGTLIVYGFDDSTKTMEMKIDHISGKFVPASYK